MEGSKSFADITDQEIEELIGVIETTTKVYIKSQGITGGLSVHGVYDVYEAIRKGILVELQRAKKHKRRFEAIDDSNIDGT